MPPTADRHPQGLRRKRIAFGLLAVLALALATELLARVVYYQVAEGRVFALPSLLSNLGARLRPSKVETAVRRAALDQQTLRVANRNLHTPRGKKMLDHLRQEYEKHFLRLVRDVKAAGSKFVVMNFSSKQTGSHGAFISRLTTKHGVDYLSFAEQLREHPVEAVSLEPLDRHLSRYGNRIVAQHLGAFLVRYKGHESGRTYNGTPAILGDMPDRIGDPDNHQRHFIFCHLRPIAFSVILNAQGLRNKHDVAIPKRRQRILCLGDSYTFGPQVNNPDTYPATLQRLQPDLEVLNAGISGTTISDQAELFRERARHAAPDVTVLQVCSNDLIGLTGLSRNYLRRGGLAMEPSPVEVEYVAWARTQVDPQDEPRRAERAEPIPLPEVQGLRQPVNTDRREDRKKRKKRARQRKKK